MPETKIIVNQMPAFKKTYKKLHESQKLLVNQAIQKII